MADQNGLTGLRGHLGTNNARIKELTDKIESWEKENAVDAVEPPRVKEWKEEKLRLETQNNLLITEIGKAASQGIVIYFFIFFIFYFLFFFFFYYCALLDKSSEKLNNLAQKMR